MTRHESLAASPPQLQADDNFQNVTRLPDGTRWRLVSRFNAVYRSFSTDNGQTWQGGFNASSKLFDAFGGLNPIPVVGGDGSTHLFVPRRLEAGPIKFDIFHYQSSAPYSQWSAPELIHDGNTGSMLKAIETSSGRLIAPFGDKAIVPPAGFRANTTVVRYRDSNSATFLLSPARLQSPVPANWNGASDGATEPSVIERPDGKLWMLMRSQTGKLPESISTNMGTTWTPAADSKFYTTSVPPCLVPMGNGDMVLLWNNATMPPRFNNQGWYGGRDVLHAAISKDGGASWKGFREIYLDPFRNEEPVAGDTGTAYPFATATADGKIITIAGQAAAKTQLRIDPAWLLEKDRSGDFLSPGTLDNWSVLKPHGNVVSVKRSRVAGAVLIDDPSPSRTKPAICSAVMIDLRVRLLTHRTREGRISSGASDLVLEEVQTAGFAVEHDQTDLGVTCISAPVLQDARVVAAVSISAASARLDDSKIQKLVDRVRQAAGLISTEVARQGHHDDIRRSHADRRDNTRHDAPRALLGGGLRCARRDWASKSIPAFEP